MGEFLGRERENKEERERERIKEPGFALRVTQECHSACEDSNNNCTLSSNSNYNNNNTWPYESFNVKRSEWRTQETSIRQEGRANSSQGNWFSLSLSDQWLFTLGFLALWASVWLLPHFLAFLTPLLSLSPSLSWHFSLEFLRFLSYAATAMAEVEL